MYTPAAAESDARGGEVDESEYLPLFKLGLGVSSNSGGIHCAKLAGMHQRIISRALEVKLAVSERREVQPISMVTDLQPSLTPLRVQGLKNLITKTNWADSTDLDLHDFFSSFRSR